MGETVSIARAVVLGTLALVVSCTTGPDYAPETPVSTAPAPEPPPNVEPAPAAAETAEDLFTEKIAPMLAERCQPCHFPGGVMYEQLPFDQPDTIRKLGGKLFGRIQDEEERQWIRDFLASTTPVPP